MRYIPKRLLFFFVVQIFFVPFIFSQAKFDDERVLLQGFYWESSRHGHPEKFPQSGKKKWYAIVKEQASRIRQGHFDMVWLPPPSFAGDFSAGYGPKEYFNLNNSYGSFIQQHAMLKELLRNGVEPVADIVINHRDGTNGWVNFTKPAWGLWAICRGDEAFTNSASGVAGTPIDQRGAEEEAPTPYAAQRGSTYAYDVFRDVDHSNKQVRKDIIKYLLQLKSAGYRGWRYDMVHGYHARWIGLYNKRTNPTFSVGEYDWDKHAEQRGWIWYTATEANTLETACSVFDFTTQFSLKGNKGNYAPWFGLGNGIGMIADNTDNQPWKQRSVTFLENHDTGFRTNEDGSTEEHHEFDSFANNWEVEQGYAYILTHPGVPCVYWKHYFDWGSVLQSRIKGLINARKVAGIHSGSSVDLQTNARQNGVYAARIVGKRGELFVRVGGSDNEWVPSLSDYHDYREYAAGEGWKVWVKLPGNPSVQQAPLNAPLPVPRYRAAATFNVPDAWLSNN